MSGFTYGIALSLTGESSVAKAVTLLEKMESSLTRIDSKMDEVNSSMKKVGANNSFGNITSDVTGLVAQLGIAAGVMNSIQTAANNQGMTDALTFSSGGEQAAAKNIAFLESTIESLHLNAEVATRSFTKLHAGMMGSGMAADETNQLFSALSKGATVLKLNSEQTEGAFLALTQMASKGTISAEELRGQLGERLYGAFSLAAEGMGVTSEKLGDMLKSGEIQAKTFLPRFTKILDQTFDKGVGQAVEGAQAKFNDLQSAIFYTKVALGNELLPASLAFLNGFLIPSIKWIGENWRWLLLMASGFAGLYVAQKVYMGLQIAYQAYLATTTFLTAGWTGATWSLNAAFWANPIGVVIGLVIGIAAAVVYAWNKFDKFRGFLLGMWEVIKWFGEILYTQMIEPFIMLGKVMYGIFTLDYDMISSAISDYADKAMGMADKLFNAGTEIAGRFNAGFEQGLNAKPIQVSDMLPGSGGALGNTKFGGTTDTKNTKNDTVTKGINNITGGGKSQKNITINLGKLQDKIEIHAANVTEGVDEMADMLMRKLAQVINSANQIQTN